MISNAAKVADTAFAAEQAHAGSELELIAMTEARDLLLEEVEVEKEVIASLEVEKGTLIHDKGKVDP